MPRRPLANVWAYGCPKCDVPAGEPCRDLRKTFGTLYGRRTHRERAQIIKQIKEAEKNVRYFAQTTRRAGEYMASYVQANHTYNWPWTTTGTGSITIPVQDATWHQWTNTATTTGAYIYQPAYTTQTVTWQAWNEWHEPIMRTVEEEQAYQDRLQARREAEALRELEYRRREEKRQAERAVANERAMDLLNLLVAPEEKVDPLELIQLVGSDGQLYRIEMHRQTVHGNIVRVDEHGCILGRACVAPRMYDGNDTLPTADGWVGQYLGLKHDAEQFLSHANWSHIRRCQQPELRVA